MLLNFEHARGSRAGIRVGLLALCGRLTVCADNGLQFSASALLQLCASRDHYWLLILDLCIPLIQPAGFILNPKRMLFCANFQAPAALRRM